MAEAVSEAGAKGIELGKRPADEYSVLFVAGWMGIEKLLLAVGNRGVEE
jgi:hypothetical protein